jgi:hypothetical protein
MVLLRAEMMAISEPAKKPLARIRKKNKKEFADDRFHC